MTYSKAVSLKGQKVTSGPKKSYEVRVRERVIIEAVYVVEASCEKEARSLAAKGITTSRHDVKRHDPTEIMVRPGPIRHISDEKKPEQDEINAKIGSSIEAEISIGTLAISLKNMTCFYKGERVRLSAGKIKILYALAMKPDVVFSREELLRYFPNEGEDHDEKAVDSAIKVIRRAIDSRNGYDVIQTSYGNGYALNRSFLEPDAGGDATEVGFRIDDLRKKVLWQGKDFEAARGEYLIIEALLRYPGVVMTRDQLFEISGRFAKDLRTIDSHIKRIRKKMALMNIHESLLETVYGIGYRMSKS